MATDTTITDSKRISTMISEEWRFIVLGKSGSGKSLFINKLVGKNICPVSCSSQCVTKKCQLVEENAHEKRLILVDTPGLFDTEVLEEETKKEIGKIIAMTAPGVHAFIVVFRIGRFTQEEIRSVEILTKLLEPELYERAIVLITGVDDLKADDMQLAGFLLSVSSELREFIRKCGNRVIGFNNYKKDVTHEVKCLLRTIGDVVEAKGNTVYTNDMYKRAAGILEKEEHHRLDADKTKNKVEVRQEIRRDIAEENDAGNRVLSLLVNSIVMPTTEMLERKMARKAEVILFKRCTLL